MDKTDTLQDEELDSLIEILEADVFQHPLIDENGKHWGNQDYAALVDESVVAFKAKLREYIESRSATPTPQPQDKGQWVQTCKRCGIESRVGGSTPQLTVEHETLGFTDSQLNHLKIIFDQWVDGDYTAFNEFAFEDILPFIRSYMSSYVIQATERAEVEGRIIALKMVLGINDLWASPETKDKWLSSEISKLESQIRTLTTLETEHDGNKKIL